MPVINIKEATLQRLKRLADPFVDTTEDAVINKVLDTFENQNTFAKASKDEQEFDPNKLPPMKHTRVLDASIDGVPVDRLNWNNILEEVLRRAAQYNGEFLYLRKLLRPVNIIEGRKNDKGYKYLHSLGISLQGDETNRILPVIIRASRTLGLALDIGFEWRDKDGAEYPGERGRIRTSQKALHVVDSTYHRKPRI